MSNEISTIPQLISELNNCKGEEYKHIVKRLELPLSAYEPFMHWNKSHYTRNCIHKTEDYELILLCWEKGQETPIHCHNDQECWVYVLKGKFKEKRFHEVSDDIEISLEQEFTDKGVSYMNDEMGFHKLVNVSSEQAMSLHLYVKPIGACNIYNEENKKFEGVNLSYYSYEGELLEGA